METDLNAIEKAGVVLGLIGPRFMREGRMEYEDIQITSKQNTYENGYGFKGQDDNHSNALTKLKQYFFPLKNNVELKKLQDYRHIWNEFYEEEDHLYKEVSLADKRFGKSLQSCAICDNVVMKKRYALAIDLLLLESNHRAKLENKLAYIHVVGIGLGIWLGAEQQEQIFMECFEQRLKYLLPSLNNVGAVHFSWFHLESCGILQNDSLLAKEDHPKNGIKILISKRNPNEKLVSFDMILHKWFCKNKYFTS